MPEHASGRPCRRRHPSGLNYSGVLPHAPYADPANATVVACNTANCWFSWAFEVDAQDTANQTLSWSRGGFQGAEGFDAGGIWYIEGVLEELDDPNEYRRRHSNLQATPPPRSHTFSSQVPL